MSGKEPVKTRIRQREEFSLDLVLRPVLKSLQSPDSHFIMAFSLCAKTLTLTRARCGERLRVKTICSDCPDCVRLQEMGFCENAEFCKIAEGGAIICSLYGMRVAIGRELGGHVLVERVAA